MGIITSFHYEELGTRANHLMRRLGLDSKEAARKYFYNNKVRGADFENIGKKTLSEIRSWLELPDEKIEAAISFLKKNGYSVMRDRP